MHKKLTAVGLSVIALLGGVTACRETPAPESKVEVVAPEDAEVTTKASASGEPEAPAPVQSEAPDAAAEAPEEEPAKTTGPFVMPHSLSQKINSYVADGFWVERGAAIQDAETGYYYLVVETEGPAAEDRDVALWGADGLDDAARVWAISPLAQEVTPGLPTPFDDGVSLYHYDGEVLIATQYIRSQH